MHINTEDIVLSLLSIGYKEIDASLFANAKELISTGKIFIFEDSSISRFTSNSHLVFNGIIFKLKEELLTDNPFISSNNALTNYLINNGFGNQSHKVRALAM